MSMKFSPFYTLPSSDRTPVSRQPSLAVETVGTPVPLLQRDVAIDVLRGWAIIMMIFSHVGPMTRGSALVHLPLYISAASWFFGLSGVVLGMVSVSRIEKSGLRRATFTLWKRVRTLWLIHCFLMFAVILLHDKTGMFTEVATPSQAGGWINVLWMVVTLRLQSNEFMNILPMYIVFMTLSPLVLGAMRRHLTGLVILLSFCLYLYTQTHPNFLRIANPLSGKQIFSLTAWQFVFFGGLALGYHHRALKAGFWKENQRWLIPLTSSVFLSLFVVAQFQRNGLNDLGSVQYHLLISSQFSNETWGPLRAIYATSMIFLCYYGVNELIKKNHAGVRFLQPLALVGRYSLYCFMVHLFFSLTVRALQLEQGTSPLQELMTVATIGIIYLMAKNRVLATIIPN